MKTRKLLSLIMAVLMRMASSLHAFGSEERLSFADQYLRCQRERRG